MGDLQISKEELLLKEYILKGNEFYYKKKYEKSIECYDKALEIDPKNATAWNNKGLALDNLGIGIGNFQYVAQGTATVGNQTTIK